ncbi:MULTISPECIES: TonB-dependent hemoglobin/transferrin/lactoferrin family receptor [unclassified Gilliamella]|uniref:TonB-dependent hemoglobin/transferrin/lactoferrin family receptor n=1 Tax=unclassified Gilliamella TaxID=2685620 RepID=UPI00226AAD23|nr:MULTISPECIES: TonB-dependent hemoglobin/transferrin/lactoferrin family receptor [unclassified Gilliamella]MCX8601424.1 TonB-dependent hemoglobin/transferrin/lactoferrin family receptor [Gilliamella sp. B3722]MCX8608931.1 TonB-dependent hemoglobin/transferrin/lactoferrin family receptor [Gilliamella sp. B3771]MCX8610606.1 TonB-dependent hemoglobin/transferrin/lactoferrin family receptor [Gilliamella sp. B3891]MCX8613155.1 TonB-dependent hemoglobin/transferrin/lactoferrin family receptor [Gill
MKISKIFLTVLAASLPLSVFAADDELETMTVTATRQKRAKLAIPETVDVITSKNIDDHQMSTMEDLVRYLPGISVNRQTSGTDPFGNLGGIRIRGMAGNRIQMQVDGARVIESIQDGNRNFIDLANIKAVEVIRGPGSVLWGADAVGGVVAFKTLDPSDLLKGKSYAVRLSGGYDSLNKQNTKTSMLALELLPNLEGLISFSRRDYQEAKLSKAKANGGIWGCPRGEDAIRCNKLNPLDAKAENMLTKLVYHNDTRETKLTFENFRSNSFVKQMYDYGLQANGTFNGDYRRTQIQTRKRYAIDDSWTPPVSFIDQIKTMFSYSPQERYLKSYRQQKDKRQNPINTYTTNDYKEKFWQLDLQLNSNVDFFNITHDLTYGFQGDITRSYYRNESTKNGVKTIGGGFNFANAKTQRADIYLQDEFHFISENLKIKPGLRYATYKIKPNTDSHYAVVKGKEPRDLSSHRLIPQLGILYNITDQYSAYARYAEGFKMPTAQQLYTSLPSVTMNLIPNPKLKPEKVKSYETGIRGDFSEGWFSVGLFKANYSNYIKNFIRVGPKDYTYKNLSNVNLWGIEASGEWHFAPNWTLNASSSYQYGKKQDSPGDKKTYFNEAMPLQGNIGLKWNVPDFNFDTEVVGTFSKAVSHVSKDKSSSDEIFKPSGYAIYDAYLNWHPSKNITIRGSVLNIFDRRYFKWPMFSSYYKNVQNNVKVTNPIELQTAPGRTFAVSAVINF